MLDQVAENSAELADLEGEYFIKALYEPKDDFTGQYVHQLADHLGILKGGNKSVQKAIRCLSDVLLAIKYTQKGLVCWPTNNGDLTDCAYGGDIARSVRQSLEAKGYLQLVKSARFGGHSRNAAVFRIDQFLSPSCLKFRQHGEGPLIEVRDVKPDFYERGAKPKGKKIPLSKFQGNVEPLRSQLRPIAKAMAAYPLVAPDGTEWSSFKRIFNDRRLDRGGRLYGDWQSLKAEERLACNIGGEKVAEIDIKASYLFLASRVVGWNRPLAEDPYQQIDFVRKNSDLRGLAKALVSAILSKPNGVTQFPKGERQDGRTVSLKERYNLPKKATVQEYVDDIYKAFPFLQGLQGVAGELMFKESELILQTMTELLEADAPVVTYPVHDCLICKRSDADKVVAVLQKVMLTSLGATPSLDIECHGEARRIVRGSTVSEEATTSKKYNFNLDWFLEDDESLIDYDDL